MISVAEVILFYSKFSKECAPCIQYIINNKLPIILIPLDDQDSRNKVFNGSTLQITKVPTLLVSYTNNDVQLYVGSQKILSWFSAMAKPVDNSQSSPNPQDIVPDTKLPSKKKKSKKVPQKTKKTTKHVVPQSDSSHHTEIIFDNEPTSTHTPTKLSSKLSTSSTKPSPNDGIMAMAKQMAAERDRHLNYKENGNG